MSGVKSGLEGVVAFATEIAEPDREGGALRYRGTRLRFDTESSAVWVVAGHRFDLERVLELARE